MAGLVGCKLAIKPPFFISLMVYCSMIKILMYLEIYLFICMNLCVYSCGYGGGLGAVRGLEGERDGRGGRKITVVII